MTVPTLIALSAFLDTFTCVMLAGIPWILRGKDRL